MVWDPPVAVGLIHASIVNAPPRASELVTGSGRPLLTPSKFSPRPNRPPLDQAET
jgi:hypothetical protein